MKSPGVRALVLLVAAVLTFGLPSTSPVSARATGSPPLRLTFLSLAHGVATLVQPPGELVGLVNCGGPGDGPELVKALKSRGVTHLDVLVIDTWSERTVGGGVSILKNFRVRQILFTPIYTHTRDGDAFYRLANDMQNRRKLEMGPPSPGYTETVFFSPPCQIVMAGPTGPMLTKFEKDPNCSEMIQFRYDHFTLLTLGESTIKEQQAFWKSVDPRPTARVLVLGRDGDASALDARLLKPLKTGLAIIPSPREGGKDPAPTTLSALRKARVRVIRTGKRTSLTLSTDGDEVHTAPR